MSKIKIFTFEQLWNHVKDTALIDDSINTLLWKKTVARFFWDEQQKRVNKITRENKALIEAVLWLADSPSDDVIYGMDKKSIIDLFRLNESKAKDILSQVYKQREAEKLQLPIEA